MGLSFIAYMPFVAAQMYPNIYTLIPSGLAVGLGGAALWCAKCTYLTILAEAFSTLKRDGKKSKELVVRFFSVFFFFYQAAQVWGNLISSSGGLIQSQVVALEEEEKSIVNVFLIILFFTVLSLATTAEENATDSINVGELCGANFCPGLTSAENNNLIKPDAQKINLLSGIFLGCMCCSVLLVALFVDSAKRWVPLRIKLIKYWSDLIIHIALQIRLGTDGQRQWIDWLEVDKRNVQELATKVPNLANTRHLLRGL